MSCTNCGGQLPENAGFCGHCGTRADVSADTAQQLQSDTQTSPQPQSSFLGRVLVAAVAMILMITLLNHQSIQAFYWDILSRDEEVAMVVGAVWCGLVLLPLIIVAFLYGPLFASISWGFAGSVSYIVREWLFWERSALCSCPPRILGYVIIGIVLGTLLHSRPVSVSKIALAALASGIVDSFVLSFLYSLWMPLYFGWWTPWTPTSDYFLHMLGVAAILFAFIWLVAAEKSPISRRLRRLG